MDKNYIQKATSSRSKAGGEWQMLRTYGCMLLDCQVLPYFEHWAATENTFLCSISWNSRNNSCCKQCDRIQIHNPHKTWKLTHFSFLPVELHQLLVCLVQLLLKNLQLFWPHGSCRTGSICTTITQTINIYTGRCSSETAAMFQKASYLTPGC